MAPMAIRAQARRSLAYGATFVALLAAAWAWQRYGTPAPSTATTTPARTSAPSSVQRLHGIATVFDADTIGVQGARLRLQGIDAPEYAQDCGTRERSWHCGRDSIAALRRHLDGHSLDCLVVGTDRYQRGLAHCRIAGDRGDDDLNRWLVRSGWAVSYGDDYLAEELLAERERAGLWRDAFERPSQWRRQHPRANDEGRLAPAFSSFIPFA